MTPMLKFLKATTGATSTRLYRFLKQRRAQITPDVEIDPNNDGALENPSLTYVI